MPMRNSTIGTNDRVTRKMLKLPMLTDIYFLFIDHLRSRYELLKLNHLNYRSRPTSNRRQTVLSCARPDRIFPRTKIRAQSAIKCKQCPLMKDDRSCEHRGAGFLCQRHPMEKIGCMGLKDERRESEEFSKSTINGKST